MLLLPLLAFLLTTSTNAHALAPPTGLGSLASLADQLAGSSELTDPEEIELDEAGEASMRELETNWEALGFGEETVVGTDGAGCVDGENDWRLWEARARRGGSGSCKPRKGRIQSGCCLMYVRMRIGLSAEALPDHAKQIGPALSRHGYCNKIGTYNAKSAPVGAVLVYSGGPSGHTEYKSAPSAFYFGPTNREPASDWTETKRHLIGVWVRCGGKK